MTTVVENIEFMWRWLCYRKLNREHGMAQQNAWFEWQTWAWCIDVKER